MPNTPLILTALRYEAAALSHLGHTEVIGIAASRLSDLNLDHTSLLVIAGLAGALDPALNVGDIIIDDRSDIPTPDLRRAHFHCSKQIIPTPDAKADLFATTGAQVVDMESDPVFTLAREKNLPFLHIRAISDAADDAIDPTVLRMTDSTGHIKPAQVAVELCMNPRLLAQLWRLRANSSLALRNLSSALQRILSHSP